MLSDWLFYRKYLLQNQKLRKEKKSREKGVNDLNFIREWLILFSQSGEIFCDLTTQILKLPSIHTPYKDK